MHLELTKLTEQEVLDLNRRIVEGLQMIDSARRLTELARFSASMASSRQQTASSAAPSRLNQKIATVVTESAGTWRVSPSSLRPIAEAESTHPRVVRTPNVGSGT